MTNIGHRCILLALFMPAIVLSSADLRVAPAAADAAAGVTHAAPAAWSATRSTPLQSDGNWIGTITTDGDVMTVTTQSGSVWPGPARLVEEARIGVEVGPDEYMFGQISAVAADGRRIIVADRQARAVRLYDYEGAFLGNVGRQGQGPGEFTAPEAVTIDEAGRIYVLDREHRVVGFQPDGTPASTFRVPNVGCCIWPLYPRPGGGVRVAVTETDREAQQRRSGVKTFAPDGTEIDVILQPEIEFERITYTVNGREAPLPISPRALRGLTPGGGLWSGTNDTYRIAVTSSDGAVLVLEKPWEPVPYAPEEREWWRRMIIAVNRARAPGWSWDGAEIPDHKPAFLDVVPVLSGGYWVVRDGQSVKRPDCTEDPLAASITGEGAAAAVRNCWTSERVIDAFDHEGVFLGEVQAPRLIGWSALTLHVDGDTVVTAAEDEDGIIRVVRYRLVLPQ